MAGRQHLEVDAFLPERIVVVAVARLHADRGDALGQLAELGIDGGDFRHRVAHLAGNGDGLEAELVDRVFQLGDGLFRGPGRDHRRRRHAVLHVVEHLGIEGVERARQHLAHLRVAHLVGGNAEGGVDDGEVDARILQPLGVKLGQHAGRPVDGVLAGRRRPEHGTVARGVAWPAAVFEFLGQLRSADVADVVHDCPFAFQHMGVGVDHRVVEALFDRRRGTVESMNVAHDVLPFPGRGGPGPEMGAASCFG